MERPRVRNTMSTQDYICREKRKRSSAPCMFFKGHDISFCLYVVRDYTLSIQFLSAVLNRRQIGQYLNFHGVPYKPYSVQRGEGKRGSRMCYAMSSLSCKKGVGEWMERGQAQMTSAQWDMGGWPSTVKRMGGCANLVLPRGRDKKSQIFSRCHL